MALLKFFRGNKAKYNITTHADCVFFALDTKEIIMNGNSYGVHSAGPTKTIQSVTYTAPGTIQINYNTGTPDVVNLQNAVAGATPSASRGGLMTADQAFKLETLSSSGGAPNVIESIALDGVDLVPVNKKVNIDTSAIRNSIAQNKVVAKDKSVDVVPGSGQGPSAQPTKISVKVDSKAGNILNVGNNGLYASLQLKKLNGPFTEADVAVRYQLTGIKGDGSEYALGTPLDIKYDRFLKTVEFSFIPIGYEGEGNEALKFTFVTNDGSDSVVYVDVTRLVQGVVAGDGLEVAPNKSLKIKLTASSIEQVVTGKPLAKVSAAGLDLEGVGAALKNATAVMAKPAGHVRVMAKAVPQHKIPVVEIEEYDIASAKELQTTKEELLQKINALGSGGPALTAGNGTEVVSNKINVKLAPSAQENLFEKGPLFTVGAAGVESTGLVKVLNELHQDIAALKAGSDYLSWYEEP
jgi:hypothetical protein|uniref:Uncharacterized protein n=1 Tax=Podoviridae sp. ctz6O13 TaxID=2827757 RepID=A0A8S5TKR1_9CAUD|nr:MAG TPA: hypothetical protein [Podoviridae sp. ctz6O13]